MPSLYTALTTGANATDPRIYGANTFPHVLKENDTVEIVLNNLDPGKHPFHLHGHNFQTVWRSDSDVGIYDATNSTVKMPPVPMKRDTVMVRPNGNLVIRFKADNPDRSLLLLVWITSVKSYMLVLLNMLTVGGLSTRLAIPLS